MSLGSDHKHDYPKRGWRPSGEPCGRVDWHGRVLPLLPPVTHPEDLPAKNEVEVEILDD